MYFTVCQVETVYFRPVLTILWQLGNNLNVCKVGNINIFIKTSLFGAGTRLLSYVHGSLFLSYPFLDKHNVQTVIIHKTTPVLKHTRASYTHIIFFPVGIRSYVRARAIFSFFLELIYRFKCLCAHNFLSQIIYEQNRRYSEIVDLIIGFLLNSFWNHSNLLRLATEREQLNFSKLRLRYDETEETGWINREASLTSAQRNWPL